MSLVDDIKELRKDVFNIKNQIDEVGVNNGKIVRSEFKKNWRALKQPPLYFGLYLALCVDTMDPMQQNRVRFFSPALNHPETLALDLPWAWPISVLGGFDDCGVSWVPPAGSTLCIIFDRGAKSAPFYIGTTWSRYRGPEGEHNFEYDMQEYYRLHMGHRKGYLVGANDESQSLPPWNTENYNTFDYNTLVNYEANESHAFNKTYPHIYGFKTPQKHMIKMVDGNYKCNHRWKRFELLSSCGNYMILKDDHLHPAIQCTNPMDNGSYDSCHDKDGNPIERPEDCDDRNVNEEESPLNPYFKHENELRPYIGPQTPQNNKVELKQSGIQLLSRSGHTFVFDDSVDEPQYSPEWEISTRPFDFGCNDKFLGKTTWKSATGHTIEMSDVEEDEQLRGENNYIRLESACGNLIELNDHTIISSDNELDEDGEPIYDEDGEPIFSEKSLAGDKRGITLRSTSNHSIEMIDDENEQGAPARREGGQRIPKAKRAYVRIRSGYGLQISLNDYWPPDDPDDPDDAGTPGSQEHTVNQHIQILCPQKDNEERGPHILHFQESPEGAGQVYLRSGGNYVCQTYDNYATIVGSPEEEDEDGEVTGNPSNMITYVSNHNVSVAENYNFSVSSTHAVYAKNNILLMAGDDCPPQEGEYCTPCVWPVLCLTPKGITISDRVYVSASANAPCADVSHLTPFHSCSPFESC